jgi:glutamate dehydrogenase/leucine dehydrogenase
MGAALIRYLSASNWHLSALGDPRLGGSWRLETCSDELRDALASQALKKAHKLLESEAEFICDNPNKVLYERCDVLLPCALQHAIDVENANLLQCRYIVEGANSPVTEAAYSLLQAQGIPVIPDFVANAGGVIAAFTEMTATNRENKVLLAKQATDQRISRNVAAIVEEAQAWHCTLREAALLRALRQLSGKY